MRWAPIHRPGDLDAARPLAQRAAGHMSAAPPESLAGPLALRGILIHEAALRAEARASAGARPQLLPFRRRALNDLRKVVRHRGGL